MESRWGHGRVIICGATFWRSSNCSIFCLPLLSLLSSTGHAHQLLVLPQCYPPLPSPPLLQLVFVWGMPEIHRQHCHLQYIHLHQCPPPPALHPRPLHGFPAMEESELRACRAINEPLWHLHLPHRRFRDFRCCGIICLLFGYLHQQCCGVKVWSVYILRYFPWTDSVPPPDLCRALPGCCSPHRIHALERIRRGQDQEYQHLVCLVGVFCMDWGNKTVPPKCCCYSLALHLWCLNNCHYFQLPFCSVCSNEDRAGGVGQEQRAGWPVKAEGFPLHLCYTGGAAVKVYWAAG